MSKDYVTLLQELRKAGTPGEWTNVDAKRGVKKAIWVSSIEEADSDPESFLNGSRYGPSREYVSRGFLHPNDAALACQAVNSIEPLTTRVRILENALKKHGKHLDICELSPLSNPPGSPECSCGLKELKELLDQA